MKIYSVFVNSQILLFGPRKLEYTLRFLIRPNTDVDISSFMFSVCFWVGRSWYKRDIPNRNIVTLFFKCSWVKFIIAANFMSMISIISSACILPEEVQIARQPLA